MVIDRQVNLKTFHFREIHSRVFIGMASDRYAGWIGQIYSPERYSGRITERTKIIAGKTFVEEVLPVDSVGEYFTHFPVLEIDFTFYQPLLGKDGKPTQNYEVLKAYVRHLKEGDRILLKAPQITMAQKIRKGELFYKNEAYLNSEIFIQQFYEPAVKLLGANLIGFVFEQEFQRREDRHPLSKMAFSLDKFFQGIPKDSRYHLELRTDLFLREPIFEVLEKHGVGQVLSHWTWLPPLRKQLAKADGRSFNRGKEVVVRLLTPIDMRYEDSYLKSYPFDKLVDGMLQPEMVLETVEIIEKVIEQGERINIIINNRAGGNAPLIARIIAEKFIGKHRKIPEVQKSLW